MAITSRVSQQMAKERDRVPISVSKLKGDTVAYQENWEISCKFGDAHQTWHATAHCARRSFSPNSPAADVYPTTDDWRSPRQIRCGNRCSENRKGGIKSSNSKICPVTANPGNVSNVFRIHFAMRFYTHAQSLRGVYWNVYIPPPLGEWNRNGFFQHLYKTQQWVSSTWACRRR